MLYNYLYYINVHLYILYVCYVYLEVEVYETCDCFIIFFWRWQQDDNNISNWMFWSIKFSVCTFKTFIFSPLTNFCGLWSRFSPFSYPKKFNDIQNLLLFLTFSISTIERYIYYKSIYIGYIWMDCPHHSDYSDKWEKKWHILLVQLSNLLRWEEQQKKGRLDRDLETFRSQSSVYS